MKILGIEKMSLVDFKDLICAVIFTGGCNFLCPFCQNKDLVFLGVDDIKEEDILDFLFKRKKMIQGVCISGGEPTLQNDLDSFLSKVREMGYKIKLDTNGTNPKMIELLAKKKLIDYVAMDIKTNFSDYLKVCCNPSIDTNLIKQSINILKKYNIDYELRTTLVNELHGIENIENMAIDLSGENLLYLQKFKDSENNITKGLHDITKVQAENYQKILKTTIKEVYLRGYN